MYLLFDIGGTKLRIAVSDDGKNFRGEPEVFPTPKLWKDAEPLMRRIFSKHKGVSGICGGLPGMLDEAKARLTWSPNLPDWVGVPLKSIMEEEAETSASLYNDALLAGVGEAVAGAGRDCRIVAFLTVSTGVGGARIVNGLPDERSQGFEPGQQIIDVEKGGTLESLISGESFRKRYGDNFVKEAPDSAWRAAARILAVGVHNTVAYWSPDVIVFGGPMILKTPGIPFEAVEETFDALVTFPGRPSLKRAELKDAAGLHGALALSTLAKS